MSAVRPSSASQTVDGKYALLAELGSGASGTVWEAEHLVVGKRVALKLLRPEVASDPRLRARFVAEARAAARIAHANVVDIYDLGVSRDGNCYMVMELLRGETLGDMLEHRGPLTPIYACELMLQVLAGVAAAHAQGIVHRDLKPDNVVVTHPRPDRPHVKVLDFGIATGLIEEAGGQAQGSIFGTPSYMAPEQVLGLAVDVRADVYAAGAMMFEMLTGQRPFGGRTATSIFSRSLAGRAVDVRVFAPNVPAELASVVSRALARDPAERQQTAAQLAAELLPFATSSHSTSSHSWIAPAVVPTEEPRHWATISCAPIPLVAAQVTQVVAIAEVNPAADFSCIELGPLSCATPPAPPISASVLELPFPAHAAAPWDWGVSVSSIPSQLPGSGRQRSTPSELAERYASTWAPVRPSAMSRMKGALYATLAGFGTGVALAWMAGVI